MAEYEYILGKSLEEILDGLTRQEVEEKIEKFVGYAKSLGPVYQIDAERIKKRIGAMYVHAARLKVVELLERGNLSPEEQRFVDETVWVYKFNKLVASMVLTHPRERATIHFAGREYGGASDSVWESIDYNTYIRREYENIVEKVVKQLPERPDWIAHPLDWPESERLD